MAKEKAKTRRREDSLRARWDTLEELGAGGQSRVFKVRRKSRTHEIENSLVGLRNLVRMFADPDRQPTLESLPGIVHTLETLMNPNDAKHLGALKEFEIPSDDKDEAARALKRLENEVEALATAAGEHGIVRLLDSDLDARCIVTEYHPGGTLADHPDRYAGDALAALRAFRPLVKAVAFLHSRQPIIVHRDIKPENIFVASDKRLLLGDFGIVFLSIAGTRLTATRERVGPRDWMPPWAHTGKRIDDPNATFDVFSLGKVLWCMVSGQSMLPYWYHPKPEYNLERLFPNAPDMSVINTLLDACVVEGESDCLPSAIELLAVVDGALRRLNRGGGVLQEGKTRPCRVCGTGNYVSRVLDGPTDRLLVLANKQLVEQYGTQHIFNNNIQRQTLTVRAFACDKCGHIELFHFADGNKPQAWRVERATEG